MSGPDDESPESAEEPVPPELEPAPVGPRFAAGVFDAAAFMLLCAAFVSLPMTLGGLVLPMWSVFAAALLYLVAPLWLFRATPGLRFFDLEVVRADGGRVDLLHAMMRELLGRGVFALAYLGTLFLGAVGASGGRAQFVFPVGLGFVLFLCALSLLGFTAVGQLMIVLRPDRRSFADRLGRTVVVKRTGHTDDRIAPARLTGVLIAVAALALGPPLLLSRRPAGESAEEMAERLRRQKLEAQFARAPDQEPIAEELIASYEEAGLHLKADEARAAHHAALEARDKEREASLRARFDKDPRDWDGAGLLVRYYLEHQRSLDAKEVYQRFVGARGDANLRVDYGVWLWENDFPQDAARELHSALDAGVDAVSTERARAALDRLAREGTR